MNTEELGVLVTHHVLAGAGLPRRELEVVPADEQEQEEGQHEELPVPHRHKEDLRRQGHDSVTQSPSHYSRDPAFSNLGNPVPKNKIYNGFNHVLNLMKSTTDCKASQIYCRWQQILLLVV